MSEGGAEGPRLTQAAYDRLQAELDELETDGRKLIAERLQRARELGDLSENAEYHETKNQQGMMEARIRKLQHMLKNAQIVAAPSASDRAEAGTIVTLKPLDGGDNERYLLAAS
ncbi:MAG TPA: transcription elongation factor GreA, partial [Actinomycetota bacterium]|nr:transcription elongation factor GreA [Actinomycetota bacterium]